MDNVYMMYALQMFFLMATFERKGYAIKNFGDYSSKEQDLNNCLRYLRTFFHNFISKSCVIAFFKMTPFREGKGITQRQVLTSIAVYKQAKGMEGESFGCFLDGKASSS